MSPIRARKAISIGPWLRVNITARSIIDFLRDALPDGHTDPGRRPWSSLTIGPRGLSYNTRRRTGRVDLPGPFSYETPKLRPDPDDGCHLCGGLPEDRSRHWPGCRRDRRPPVRWTDQDGRRWEQTERPDGGTATRHLPHADLQDAALQQPCDLDTCLARPGHWCRTRSGRRAAELHVGRYELARVHLHHAPIPPWGTPPDPTGDDQP